MRNGGEVVENGKRLEAWADFGAGNNLRAISDEALRSPPPAPRPGLQKCVGGQGFGVSDSSFVWSPLTASISSLAVDDPLGVLGLKK